MSLLGFGAVVGGCNSQSSIEERSFSDDGEIRNVMDNFINNEVAEWAPLVNARDAALLSIVSLTVQQSDGLLREAVCSALEKNVKPEEILEAVYQCAPYSGFPRVVDAVKNVREVFKMVGVKVDENRATVNDETRLQKGAETQTALFRTDSFIKAIAGGKSNMPPIRYFLSSNCFGDYYTRKGLDLETRELLTMAMLVNLGTEPQLKAHIKANLGLGKSKEFLEQVLYTILPYCGYPRILNALALLSESSNEVVKK